MKITTEILKGLNVTAYMDYIKDTCDKIETASVCLPLTQDRLNELCIAAFGWHTYDINCRIDGKSSYWYNKYKALSDARITELKAQIENFKDDIRQIFILADPLDFKNELANNKHDLEKVYLSLAKTIDFNNIALEIDKNRCYFDSSIEYDLDELERKSQFNTMARQVELNKYSDHDFKFVDWVQNGTFNRSLIFDSDIIQELALLEFLHKVATYGEEPNVSQLLIPKQTLGKTQFTELVKSLFEAKVLQYDTEKQAVETLSKALGIEITKQDFDKILQKMKNRNIGDETLFLDKLKTALTNWINRD